MVISCRLNVSLKSNLVDVFDLDGKNGDDTSSSSLQKKQHKIVQINSCFCLFSSARGSPNFRFVFNE